MSHTMQIVLAALLSFILGLLVCHLAEVMPRQSRIDAADKQLIRLETETAAASAMVKRQSSNPELSETFMVISDEITKTRATLASR